MSRRSDPDKVTHDRSAPLGIPLPEVPGTELYETTIHKDDRTYTGYGWSEQEANKNAGERYEHNKPDRK